jgi:acetyl-CoA carboxylase biotin carboxylase subunit
VTSKLPLSLSQRDVRFSGHAMECRVTAESADRNFLPNPGRIQQWVAPTGAGVRVGSHCYASYVVPPYYDSLLANVIAHANTRDQVIARMDEALSAFEGVSTTIPFLRFLINQRNFAAARTTVCWVEKLLAERMRQSAS